MTKDIFFGLDNIIYNKIENFLLDDSIAGINKENLKKIKKTSSYVREDIKGLNNISKLIDFLYENKDDINNENIVNVILATTDYIAKYLYFDITEKIIDIACKNINIGDL